MTDDQVIPNDYPSGHLSSYQITLMYPMRSKNVIIYIYIYQWWDLIDRFRHEVFTRCGPQNLRALHAAHGFCRSLEQLNCEHGPSWTKAVIRSHSHPNLGIIEDL